MLYDIDLRRQLARERAEHLAHEMRRARGLTPDQAGYPGLARLAKDLLGRADRLRRGKELPNPSYEA
jgi:hypothetical protein